MLTVYIGSDDGNIYALDAGTGRKMGNFTTGGSVDSSPFVDNDVIYVDSGDGSVYAPAVSTA